MRHRHDVQGLRAVAIAAVLLFHFFPELFPNGFLGVDIFFVISGYLISTVLGKALRQSASAGLTRAIAADFYYRRMKRLAPLHLAYVASATLLFSVVASPSILDESKNYAIAALLFLTNIYSLFDSSDYFERILDENLFTHIWSLSVEVQFYLVAPFVVAIQRRQAGGGGTLFLVAACTLSLLLHLFSSPTFAFNAMPARLWQFLATALLSLGGNNSVDGEEKEKLLEKGKDVCDDERGHSKQQRLHTEFVCLLGSLLLAAPFLPLASLPLAISRCLVTLATALIIVHGGDAKTSSWLAHPPLPFIGDISYSFYLIHWPFSVYFVSTTAIMSYERLSTIPLSFLSTLLIFYVYERPYRTWTKEHIKYCCSFFFVLSIVALLASAPINNFFHKTDVSVADAIRQNEADFKLRREILLIPECRYSMFRNRSSSSWHVDHIQPPYGQCDLPDGTGRLRFAVVGNSYAANQADLVWRKFKPFFSTFRLFSQPGCEVLEPFPNKICTSPIKYIEPLDEFHADVTFLIQRHYGVKQEPKDDKQPDEISEKLVERFNEIANKSSLFFILDSTPVFEDKCMRKMNDMIRANTSEHEINDACVLREEEKYARARTTYLAEKCANCILYDMAPALLDDRGAFAAYDGKTHLAFFEPFTHLTHYGRTKVEAVYEDLAKKHKKRLKELEKSLYPSES